MILNAQIDLGTGSTTVGPAPVSTYFGYSYVQQIFTKQEINANAAGNITGLKFYLGPDATLDNSSDWVVYLGHTAKTSFASDSDWIPVSELTQVYAGSVTQNNGVVEITFATPFAYNNTQSLVIAAQENMDGYDSNDSSEAFYVYSGSANSTLYYRDDYDPADPADPPYYGDLSSNKSVTTIMGLTASPLPPCPTVTYPANNAQFVPLSPEITWSAATGAQSYKVSIGTTPGGTDVVNQQSVSTETFTPSAPLAANTTYYLKVVSVAAAGESSGCLDITFKTAPPPPANDDCENAVTLTPGADIQCTGTVSGYTLGATDSGLAPDPCYGNPDDDVWYKFTATSTGHVITLSNVVSLGSSSSTDTYFQVLSGTCGNMESKLCSDPLSGSVNGLTVGETYYIRVYSYGGEGRAQSFDICVGTLPPPPTNDDCDTAVQLTPNAGVQCTNPVAGHTLGATDSGMAPDPCYGTPDDDVWYKFTATSTSHIITLSDIVSLGNTSSTDTYFQVLSGVCGGTMESKLCSDPETGTVTGLNVGETYYIRVYSYGGEGRAQSFKICVGTLPPAPANDACSGALAATTFPYSYTQTDGISATNNDGFITACEDGEMNDGTWFTFTGDGSTHNITVNSSFDAAIGVYSGSCDNMTCEGNVDNAGSGSEETIAVPTVAGTVYYVNVGYYSGTYDEPEGEFTITINKDNLATSEVSKGKDAIKAYPNPFTDVLNISKIEQVKTVLITDVAGRLIKTIENPSSALHLGDLKQGLYFVTLQMKDGSKQTLKAIKK
jgi:hypothetical protein